MVQVQLMKCSVCFSTGLHLDAEVPKVYFSETESLWLKSTLTSFHVAESNLLILT